MKTAIIAAAALAISAGSASATVYEDNQGNHFGFGDLHDFFQGEGWDHLDIDKVEITNDATWLTISVDLVGDVDATNWGKYAIGIDTGNSVGDNSNGWGRNIDWGRNINFWSATWADDGGGFSGVGGELYSYNDGTAGWDNIDQTYGAGTEIQGDDSGHGDIHTWRLSLAALGIGIGDTIEFDIVATGGTGSDPGVDHLSRSDFTTDDWANGSAAGQFLSYTLVPTPGSLALLGLGGLATARRRR